MYIERFKECRVAIYKEKISDEKKLFELLKRDLNSLRFQI